MRTVAMALLAAALAAAGTTMRAQRDQTARPGESTDGKIWILNRSRADAVAVNLSAADVETPLRVVVTNAQTNPHTVALAGPARTQALRQDWEYETVLVGRDSSLQALKSLGTAGWETTGVSWPSTTGQGITVLLKRPR